MPYNFIFMGFYFVLCKSPIASQGHAHSLKTKPSPTRRLLLVENVGKVAPTAVLAVVHGSHEDTGTALEEDLLVSNVPIMTL